MKRLIFLLTAALILVHPCLLSAAPAERQKANDRRLHRYEHHRAGMIETAKPSDHASPKKTKPSGLLKTNPDYTLSEISRCPFQIEGSQHSSGFPVITDFGETMIVYTSDWPGSILYSKSQDGTQTWLDPVEICQATWAEQISGLRTAEGRIIAVWRQTDAGLQIAETHSDDEGATWSAPSVIENSGIPFNPTILQSADGRLWLFFSRTWDWDSFETRYRISGDGGATWGPAAVFPTSGWRASDVTLVSEPGLPVVALYDEGDSQSCGIFARTLSAGGEWTDPPVQITDPSEYARHPRALLKPDGSQVLVYTREDKYWVNYAFDYTQSTVAIRTRPPDADAWSVPDPFTRYKGENELSNVCLREDQAFILFASDRRGMSPHLYYGQAGESEDVNPPPVFAGMIIPEPRAGRPVTLLVYAFDESKVKSVTYTMMRNDRMEGPFPMADDGVHGDSLASDGKWGASIGPFNPGEIFGLSFKVRDDGGNAVETANLWFTVPAVHDAGNMVLQVGEDGWLSNQYIEGLGAYWPKSDGMGYLSAGGFWACAEAGGERRVSSLDWQSMDWTHAVGTPFTVRPGISDQDIDVAYADTSLSAMNPIGLVVRQKSLQWSGPTRDDFIIVDYKVRNIGLSGNLDSLFTAIWLDADVPWNAGDENLPGYDASRGLLYLRSAAGEPAGWFGCRMLGPAKAPHSIHALPPRVTYSAAYDDAFRYDLLAGGAVSVPENTADYGILIAAPPFSLASGASFTVSFGIVLGNGLEELQANADTMLAVYNRLNGITAVDRDPASEAPVSFGLEQNHPNPFNPSTFIGFRLPVSGSVTVAVCDVMGREVAVLADRLFSAGSHRLEWNASGFESGVYFCRIRSGEYTAVRKMVLMK